MDYHNWDDVQEATRSVRARWDGTARVGLILGTGLGALAEEIVAEAAIPYPEIPHFPHSTVESHGGSSSAARWPASRSSRWRAASTCTRDTPPRR